MSAISRQLRPSIFRALIGSLTASLLVSVGCSSDAGPRTGTDVGAAADGAHHARHDAARHSTADTGHRADANFGPDAGDDTPAPDAGGPDAGTGPRPIGPRPVTPTPLSDGTLFASPDGTGTDCTQATPCDLWKATDQAQGGDVVFLRGGVYSIDKNLYFRGRGTSPKPAVFESYPGEQAVLEGTGDPNDEYYVRVLGDAVVLRLFEVREMPRAGLSVRSSDHLLEGLHVHHNRSTGIHVHESYDVPSSNRNLIRDCVIHDNSDAGLAADGGNADGISMSSGIGNRVENCLVYANSDDGIDTWRTFDSYVGYSISAQNGIASGNGMGIKAGGAPPSTGTVVEHCISHSNRATGFTNNSGVDVVFSYNTSWNNSGGYYSDTSTTVDHNIAAEGSASGGNGMFSENSWQRDGAPMFLSEDPESANFLVPAPGSGFEDIGAYANRE